MSVHENGTIKTCFMVISRDQNQRNAYKLLFAKQPKTIRIRKIGIKIIVIL